MRPRYLRCCRWTKWNDGSGQCMRVILVVLSGFVQQALLSKIFRPVRRPTLSRHRKTRSNILTEHPSETPLAQTSLKFRSGDCSDSRDAIKSFLESLLPPHANKMHFPRANKARNVSVAYLKRTLPTQTDRSTSDRVAQLGVDGPKISSGRCRCHGARAAALTPTDGIPREKSYTTR